MTFVLITYKYNPMFHQISSMLFEAGNVIQNPHYKQQKLTNIGVKLGSLNIHQPSYANSPVLDMSGVLIVSPWRPVYLPLFSWAPCLLLNPPFLCFGMEHQKSLLLF